MPMINDEPQESSLAISGWHSRNDESAPRETTRFPARLDFRQASNHLSQKKPGYYLILLRNELRHRSLRDKPCLAD